MKGNFAKREKKYSYRNRVLFFGQTDVRYNKGSEIYN